MSTARDYVPHNAAQYYQFMNTLLSYVQRMSAGWANIPAERIDELKSIFNIFAAAFKYAQETPPPANMERRREAQAESTAVLRASRPLPTLTAAQKCCALLS